MTTAEETVDNALDRSDRLLAEATSRYDFDNVFAMVSGGNDSSTALDVADRSPNIDLDGIIFIDTGIKVNETREFVRDMADKRGLEFHAIDDEFRLPQEKYENLVKVYGFPGPPVHNTFYYNLKGKPLTRFLKQVDGETALISGVLKDESQRRWENIGDEPIQEKDEGIWISPLHDWLEATVDVYRNKHGLESNPVTEKLHVSGDCLCAAYGSREELRELQLFYPETAEKIARLEREVVKRAEEGKIPVKYALWGHGRTEDREIAARSDPEQAMFELCTDCEQRCSGPYDMTGDPETVAEAHLKHEENYLGSPHPVYCVQCDAVAENGLEHRQEYHPDAGASPKDLDIRVIPPRTGDIGDLRVTQGSVSPKHPDGDLCHNYRHDFEPYDGENDVAVAKCSDCGAFEIQANLEQIDLTDVHLTAAPTSPSLLEPDGANPQPVDITPEDSSQSQLGGF